MNRPAFFDTNILLYGDDHSDPPRQARAVELIKSYQGSGSMVISIQVLQEYFSAATRELGVDPEIAQRKVGLFARARVVRLTEDDVIGAIELHRLHRTSFWDALIVQAARVAGTDVLFSEDLQHGSVLAGVRIRNPFLPTKPS